VSESIARIRGTEEIPASQRFVERGVTAANLWHVLTVYFNRAEIWVAGTSAVANMYVLVSRTDNKIIA